ncbi:hypothetical protein [uncultured Ruminococcus sp.]|uniref:hypothetical protein n=1 Tax=uncultured Ruminococcus sp. TaxID=165186 RepID=UPI0025EF987E|nr:hypothetical protein [uncultured Ruminococcus sp.]
MITDTLIVCMIAVIQLFGIVAIVCPKEFCRSERRYPAVRCIGIAVTIAGTAAMTLFIFLRR